MKKQFKFEGSKKDNAMDKKEQAKLDAKKKVAPKKKKK